MGRHPLVGLAPHGVLNHGISRLEARTLSQSRSALCHGIRPDRRLTRRDITARLTGRILERAQAFGADAVVVACPLCHMNLDLRQRQAVGGSMKMPVLYFTQLMGLALGLPHQELGFEKLCVSPDELLRKIDAAQAAKAAAAKADEATEEAKA